MALATFIDGLKANFLWSDDIVFVITSDHGQSKITNSKTTLITWVKLINAINKNDRSFNINNSRMAANGGMAHIYVAKRGRISTNWSDDPDFCNDIIQLAAAIYNSRKTLGEYILERNGEKMILIKNRADGKYYVYTGKGLKECSAYKPIDEFFDLDGDKGEVNAIKNLYSKSSGDIIILANYDKGYDFYDSTFTNNFLYCGLPFKKRCPNKSKGLECDHGNIVEQDRKIPFIICGERVKSGIVEKANQVDIAPTVADILGFSMPGVDGTSIFQK